MINYNQKEKELVDVSESRVSRSQLKSEQPSRSSINDSKNNSVYSQIPCNVIIWGKWKKQYEEPILLNIESIEDKQAAPMQCHFYEMRAGQDFCFFITENGDLYVMGTNNDGMLGLGKKEADTKGLAKRIKLGNDEDNEVVRDVKIGKTHVLALTNFGKVYAWGSNIQGQVGCPPMTEESKGIDKYMTSKGSEQAYTTPGKEPTTIWEPRLVYPTEDHKDVLQGVYDDAIQIEAYEDTSFLLTQEGFIYSWGKSDNGFLAREPSLDVKQFFQTDKKKNLQFSNQIPVKVTKLEKFVIKKIKIDNGKFFAYLVDNINEFYQENEENDSDRDTEEEKDQVPDTIPQTVKNQDNIGNSSSKGGSNQNQDFTSAAQSKGGNVDRQNSHNKSKSSNRSGGDQSQMHGTMTTSRMGGLKGRGDNRGSKNLTYFQEKLKIALHIKEDMTNFDRQLADSVKPLADFQEKNIYSQVLDKFSLGEEKLNDAEELRLVIDRMQVQLKKNYSELKKFETKITELQSEINSKAVLQRGGDDDLYKDLNGLIELLFDSLALKKFNLVGCKMKVYQERMREINFLEMVSYFRENDQHLDIDKCGGLLLICKKLCKKIQEQLKKHQEQYVQLHKNMSIPSSLTLSALTNSVYQQCDIWNGINNLSSYTYILQTKIQEAEYTNEKIRQLMQQFEILQKTDFNKKVEEYKPRKLEYDSTKEWFDAMMSDIHKDIKGVIFHVRNSIKDTKGNNDILHDFQTLVHDAALIRQLLYSAQQALLEGAQIPNQKGVTAGGPGSTKGGPNQLGGTRGGGQSTPNDNDSFVSDDDMSQSVSSKHESKYTRR